MTLHSLVLISDSFSCNCNSIQSPVSIVHLRVNLILSHPLLRLYINYSISKALHFSSSMYSNVTTSTRINILQCTYVHLRLFYLRVILQGFVDPIMQHGVRIEAVFVSLQQGEHMVESTAVSCILHTFEQ